MEPQMIPNSQSNAENFKNEAEDITIPNFKLYYRATIKKKNPTKTWY